MTQGETRDGAGGSGDGPARRAEDLREDLVRAREDVTFLAAQLGHDLRTPLTAVVANAEMLAAEPAVAADRDLAWMVDSIARAAGRMDRMIEDMLAHARLGGEPVREETDLGQVAEGVIADLRPQIADTLAHVVVAELPRVWVDPAQAAAVLGDLLSNALRFARPGVPPVVEVDAERLAGRWRVSLRDNGVGIPLERQAEVFVLFGRVDKRSGGDGVGLARVKRAVEAHGGRVGLESEPGSGTTVWFELPDRDVTPPEAPRG